MPDRTANGQAVDDAAREIKRRRLELDVMVAKTEIARKEVEILERLAEVKRYKEVIQGLQVRINELEAALNG